MSTDLRGTARFADLGTLLREAVLDERRAYEEMRALVPDLALPLTERRPLSAQQEAVVDEWTRCREQLDALRGRRRTVSLSELPAQSV